MKRDKYSAETWNLFAGAGKIAAQLGCLEISTIHLFLADCESKREDSIFYSRFSNQSEYALFKEKYQVTGNEYNLLSFLGNLPFSSEASLALRESGKEMRRQKHAMIYPCHLFIAAFKIKETLLAQCFSDDKNALANLLHFYKTLQKDGRLKLERESYSGLIRAYTRLLPERVKMIHAVIARGIRTKPKISYRAQSPGEYFSEMKAVLEKEHFKLLAKKNAAMESHRFEEAASYRKIEKAMLTLLQSL